MIRVLRAPSAAVFADRVLPWLERDPVRNNVACGLVEQRGSGAVPTEADALFLSAHDDSGALVGVALRTPPHLLLLTVPMTAETVAALADWCALNLPDLPGVAGPIEAEEAFVDRWRALTGASVKPGMSSRMFRLDVVAHPLGVPGKLARATGADRDVIRGWVEAFHREALPDEPSIAAVAGVDRRIEAGQVFVWHDGEPVSMLWVGPPSAGIVRVSAVYTPPALRGRGYASACVAGASQAALDGGALACMLYTDLANPTSNKIYQEVGYVPVQDARAHSFTPVS